MRYSTLANRQTISKTDWACENYRGSENKILKLLRRTEGSQVKSPGFQPWENQLRKLRAESTQDKATSGTIRCPFRAQSFS